MNKKNPRQTNPKQTQASSAHPKPLPQAGAPRGEAPSGVDRLRFVAGALAAGLGLIAGGLLMLDHLGAATLPGCGVGSGCAAAAKSPWARVLGVPVAALGTAYFLSVLVAWCVERGRIGLMGVWMVRAGAASSLVYVGISLGANIICAYCMTMHGANLLLLIAAEAAWRRGARPEGKQPIILIAAGLASLSLLGALDLRVRHIARDREEAQLAESLGEMMEATRAGSATSSTTPATPTPPTTPSANTPATTTPAGGEGRAATRAAPRALKGRYTSGPERAPVRIVMFTDYQCPDCARIEKELQEIMRTTAGVSVGIKYFPLSSRCNPHMSGTDLHPNACWAARAAETAGMLRGVEGFWQMHTWLFERGGSFTDAELAAGLAGMGYDRRQFESVMQSAETLRRVTDDVAEGYSLGLFFTPMIFINGVELKGWNAPQALTRAVQAVASLSLPAEDASEDVPPDGRSRIIADWREQPVIAVPERLMQRTLGPSDAEVTVVVFGDYQEKNTGEADGFLRVFTSGPRPNVRYSFAHYPVNRECNPSAQRDMHPQACLAARAAVAAEAMGGPEAFWKMHDWLMANQGGVSRDTLPLGAHAAGVDAAMLLEALDEPFVSQAIAEDGRAATALGIRSLPMVIVNGKVVPRWRYDNENLLAAIIMEAAAGE
ncbi:MAG: thioredoxin domain-containing protein [Phycisphaeraceae bacterium]|nr:thioredoxin domain-containing protein [Phycisphaeraceae bacterium]